MLDKPTPAVFLDRDGVIIENRADYVKAIDEAVFLPGALEALARLAPAPYRIVIATNQSAVGRGIIPLAEAQAINAWVLEEIRRAGGRVDAAYMCPHAPHEGCACRKPKPGLLLDAAQDLNLDLPRSFLIGDALTDLLAARAAGVRPILLRSGFGVPQADLTAHGLAQVDTFANLAEAVASILSG